MAETKNSRIAAAMLVMVICFSEIHAWGGYGGGSGTSTDPFLIETAEQLNTIGTDPNNWGKHFKLVADIDLSTYPTDWFHPIGSSGGFTNLQPFKGVFDGDGHAIIGLSYSTQEVYSTGLFAYVRGDGASVKNLRLIAPRIDAPKATRVGALIGISSYGVTVVNCSALNVTITGNDYVGGLIGQCSGPIQSCSCTGVVASNGLAGGLTAATDGGKVVECHFDGAVTGKNNVGGLIGSNRVDITSCSTAGSVTGYSQVGGLVGYAHPGKIAACCSTAAVSGTGEATGGLVGKNASSTIESCWASGDVGGSSYVGGFAGSPRGAVTHCWASGTVQGHTYVGGFAGIGSDSIRFSYSVGKVSGDENVGGFTPGGLPYLCYWDVQTSGIATGGGRGRTTAQMKSKTTFPGWGYGGKWVIADGLDYPRLVWENTGGNLLVDLPRTYAGGIGSKDDPYRIDTVEQFLEIGCYRDDFAKHFLLTNDLNFDAVNTNEFIPITIDGSFNGGGHRILDFRYMTIGSYSVGFFSTIGYNGSVQDLHLVNAEVSGTKDVGILAGHNLGKVTDCSVTGVVEGNRNIGGLIGYNANYVEDCTAKVQVTGQTSAGALAGQNTSRIESCSAEGRVTGQSSLGGLVGRNDKEIVHSFSTADVSGKEEIGGLVGTAGKARSWTACPAPPAHFVAGLSDSRITACYSLGQVVGLKSVGGLVGKNSGVIMGCYAANAINAQEDSTCIGGLVGENEYGIVHSSYWDTQVSGITQSAGGRGRTTSQMTAAETFNGWSCFEVWAIDEGESYPYFTTPETSGQPIVENPLRYGGGDGTSSAPYRIETPAHFANIGCYPSDWDKAFVLTADLDLAGVDANNLWPIGILTTPFAGVFDGNGHTIANLVCRRNSELYVGLFGSIGKDLSSLAPNTGEVLNLDVRDVNVSGDHYVGGLAAYNGGILSFCTVTGQVAATGKNAGGLAGSNEGTITNCSSTCALTAKEVVGTIAGYSKGNIASAFGAGTIHTTGERDSYAGGLVGENGGTIELSHFTGSIQGGYTAGGLVALNEGTISMCSARATVTGSYLLGGLVGYNEYMKTISQSFAEGIVTGGNTVGGLAGYNGGQIRDCFAIGQVEGNERIGGLIGDTYALREIKSCYSACRITGNKLVGGFVGTVSWGAADITSCFWDVDLAGTLDGVANVTPDPNGVCGLSTLAMRTAAPFLAAGWSLSTKSENRGESIWWILEGESYPRLSWEPRDQASSQNPPSEGERQGQDALAANRVAPATTAVANQRKASIARRQISRPQSVQMPAPQ